MIIRITMIIIVIIIIRRTHWSRACQIIGIFLLNYLGSILSLLRSLRGPRRRQILLGSKGAKVDRRKANVRRSSWGAHNLSAGSMDLDLGVIGVLLEGLLVAARCPRDPQSLIISCQEHLRCKSEPTIGLRSLKNQ